MKFTSRTLFFIVLIFLLTLKTHRTYIGQGDEPHYIVVAESLTLDHDLDVANNYQSPWLRDFPSDGHMVVRRDHNIEYPMHPIGLSVLGIPVYALAHGIVKTGMAIGRFQDKTERWVFVKNMFSFTMMLLAGCLSILLFKIFLILTEKKALSWSMALIFSLSPPLMAYGLVYFTELPSAVLIAHLTLRLLKNQRISPLDALIIGFLPWLHAKYYTIALMFAIIFTYEEIRSGPKASWRDVSKSLVGPALIAGSLWIGAVAMNYYLWGGFSPSAAWAATPIKTFDVALLPIALPALFTDRSFGLFVFAPLYALFPCGWLLMYKRRKKTALQLLILLTAYFVTLSGFKCWWGNWSPPPRYIVPVAPLLAMSMVVFIDTAMSASRQWKRIVLFILGVTSVMSLSFWQVPQLLWNQEDGVNLFLIRWFGERGRHLQEYLPNFFLPSPAPQVQFLFYTTVIAVLTAAAFRDLKRR